MKIKSCAAVLCGIAASHCFADNLPGLLEASNPTRLTRQVVTPVPAQQPSVTAPKVLSPRPTLTENTLIDVRRITFIGGTVYPLKTLAAPFTPLIGKRVPVKRLIKLTDEITQRYHDDGYLISYAWLPADNFKNGEVRIGLVEGYIVHTKIDSDNKAVTGWMSKNAKRIMAEKPLTQDTFERYSLLMTRQPASEVTVSAVQPKNIYGATDLNVTARHPRYFDVTASSDNRKGEKLVYLNGNISGLTNDAEQLSITTIAPFDDKTRKSFFGLNWQQYLNDDGLQLQIDGLWYQQSPKDFSQIWRYDNGVILDAKQKETQYSGGASLNYPLLLTRKHQWSISGRMDYLDKRYDYTYRAHGFGREIALPDMHYHTRYPAAELTLKGYREYNALTWNSRFNVRQGINDFGADQTGNPADLSFTRWKWNGDASWALSESWRLNAALEGDWSDNDLPEAEQVYFGGLRFGRGYPDSEATGDYGYGGQLELRYIYPINTISWLSSVQPYTLVDTARTRFNRTALPDKHLASYAAGLTFAGNKYYALSVEGARPIGDRPSDSDSREWRINTNFTWRFNGN